MVVVNLMGGLGNQLCMYAYGMYLKQKYNYEVVLDSSWFDKYGFDCDNKEKREMLLNEFNIKIPIISFSTIDKIKILPCNAKLRYVFNAIAFRTFYKGLNLIKNKYMPIEDTKKAFDKNMLDIKDNSYISGYFTSYEYFKDVYLDLKFIGSLDSKNLQILEIIKNTRDSIALHIRRGDYINIHGYVKLGGTYYNSAINFMNNKLKDCHYFIFSNDIDFIKNDFIRYLNSDIKYSIVDIQDNNPAFEMYLMSCCNHQIIANSTFSFWAALLNTNKNKIVITPDRFAYDRNKDFFPKDWIIINHLWGGVEKK